MNHSKVSQEVESLQRDIDILQKLLGQVKILLSSMPAIETVLRKDRDEDPQKIVDRHIKLLHTYNESKDAAQAILGRLAAIKQTTVAQIHEEYDLPLQE
ncbi:unnamed protein product [Rhizoctonia solani]|uniref:Uncharacterized protein n=1 Tax=Rhizoctonia solani TaxID=456999 RepID=A0A8H3DAB0_9AGAM|nr:unnamed protein product [Rhizoctonia solani]